ncbi:Hypothetical protein HVR_LOCUS618 [uncultured virus]|nr:Hypothetical protein HVR_LOCUS618 [uncultured virus]
MDEGYDIPITDLITISEKIIVSFYAFHDIYSLLVLSLLTVSIYSQKKRKLHTPVRIDLAIIFLPDLIQYLVTTQIITDEIGTSLSEEILKRRDELPLILTSYIRIARGLKQQKNSKPINLKRKCCII